MDINSMFDNLSVLDIGIENERKSKKSNKKKLKSKEIQNYSSGNITKKGIIEIKDNKQVKEIEKEESKDKRDQKEDKVEHPYKLVGNLMTKAESKLFKIMHRELNKVLECINKEVMIFPKVRLGDIVTVHESVKDDFKYLYKIASKHIDYTVCDGETYKIVCVIELDDFYHYKESKKQRDKFVDKTLKDCGVEIFRINTPINNVSEATLSNIIDYILDYYSPICPKCGKIMTYKKSYKSFNYGHRFYGCSGWKRTRDGCNFNINID